VKILGLVGGTTWLSTAEYYAHINRMTNSRLGGDSSAKLVLVSLDMAEIVGNNERDDHEANGRIVVGACKTLKTAGAEGIVICANTMHMFAAEVEATIGLPVIHVARETAARAKSKGCKKVALLGTKFTMEMDFYKVSRPSFPTQKTARSFTNRSSTNLVRESSIQKHRRGTCGLSATS
jgi:aspartate racemase